MPVCSHIYICISVHIPVSLSIYQGMWLSISPSVCLFICASLSLSVWLYGSLSIHIHTHTYIYIYIYKGVSPLVDFTLLQEVISWVFVIKTVRIKYVWIWTVTELWAFFNSRTRPRVNCVLRNRLLGNVLILVAYRLRQLQRATRAVHNRAAACVVAGGGIFENQL